MNKQAVAVIMARSGSKELKDKNIRTLGAVPLLGRAVAACLDAGGMVGRVIVSTDDDRYADVALKFGAEVSIRPAELATDTARIDEGAAWTLRSVYGDSPMPPVTLMVQANIPIWAPGTIASILKRMAIGDVTGVMTGHEVRERPEWMMKAIAPGSDIIELYGEECRYTNRQQLPEIYHIDGQVCAVHTAYLLGPFPRIVFGALGPRIAIWKHEMPYTLDVESESDLVVGEALLTWNKEKK